MSIYLDPNESSGELNELKRYLNTLDHSDPIAKSLDLFLKEREMFLKSNIVVFRWYIIEDFPISYVSENVFKVLGYSQSEFLKNKMSPKDIVPHEMFDTLNKKAWKNFNDPSVSEFDMEYICVCKNGKNIWVNDRTIVERDGYGKPIAAWGFMRDIDERKKAEISLIESEKKFRELFENTNDAIFFTDKNGKIIDLNMAMADLFGYRKDEMLKLDFTQCYVCPKTRQKLRVLIDQKGFVKNYEVAFKKNNGAIIFCEMTTNKRFDAFRSTIGYQSIIRDITKKKEVEKQLLKSRKELRNLSHHLQIIREEERSSIAREIHDELGQILTSLKMRITAVKNMLGGATHHIVKRMESIVKLVDMTIGSVQKISKELRPSVLDDLGLYAAIRRELREFQNWAGIQSNIETDCDDIELSKHLSTDLFRTFQEALTNVARHSEASTVHVTIHFESGNIVMEIKDNGKGITSNEINHPKSMGLIGIRERVHFWKGIVNIEGKPGIGTLIRITIPYQEREKIHD